MAEKQIVPGKPFEEHTLGRIFHHHWGRTILASDNVMHCTLTVQLNPLYWNSEYARTVGYRESPIHPLLVWNAVAGLTVEDLSEAGGLFLGLNKVKFFDPVYPGDTVTAHSEVVEQRLSDSRPGWGIVTWRTWGENQRGERVVEFERTNLVRCRQTQ